MRILNAEPHGYSAEARAVLAELGEVREEPLTQEKLVSRVADVDVLIVRLGLRVTREILDAAPRLRAIVTATTGLDHIDLGAAAQREIAVLSLQGEAEFLRAVTSTAEHTWALLLALVHRIPWAFDDVRRGGWARDRFRGTSLAGRRLGLLGLGRVGEQVARYGMAFGMGVGAYDPFRAGWVEGVQRFVDVEGLLRHSDVLSIHAPLNEATQGLLSAEHLTRLPHGAVVVNTSRGAIVDERALVSLLERGQVAGAALDVLSEEQPASRRRQSPLLRYARTHDNVLITPHLGGATAEAMHRTELFMAEKLKRFLSANPHPCAA